MSAIETFEADLVGTPYRALVIRPTADIVVGRDRLGALRGQIRGSAVDQAIVEAAAANERTVLSVFCGENPATGARWHFDDSLGDAECEELGYLLVRSQLATYRALLRSGIHAHVRVGIHGREQEALRMGRDSLSEQLRTGDEVDRWIIDNFVFIFTMSLNTLVNKFVARNRSRFDRMFDATRRFAESIDVSTLAP